MTSSINSALKADKSRRYPAEELEAQKTNIERVYVTEYRPLQEDIRVFYQQYGFIARYYFRFFDPEYAFV